MYFLLLLLLLLLFLFFYFLFFFKVSIQRDKSNINYIVLAERRQSLYQALNTSLRLITNPFALLDCRLLLLHLLSQLFIFLLNSQVRLKALVPFSSPINKQHFFPRLFMLKLFHHLSDLRNPTLQITNPLYGFPMIDFWSSHRFFQPNLNRRNGIRFFVVVGLELGLNRGDFSAAREDSPNGIVELSVLWLKPIQGFESLVHWCYHRFHVPRPRWMLQNYQLLQQLCHLRVVFARRQSKLVEIAIGGEIVWKLPEWWEWARIFSGRVTSGGPHYHCNNNIVVVVVVTVSSYPSSSCSTSSSCFYFYFFLLYRFNFYFLVLVREGGYLVLVLILVLSLTRKSILFWLDP